MSNERQVITLRALFTKYREQIMYVFFGALTTLVNWLVYWLFEDFLSVSYLWSTALSQAAAILFAYVTNRIWVFESKVHGFVGISVEIAKFFGCRGASFVLDLLCMYVGVDILHINDKLMKLIANIIIIIVNYALSKLLVFGQSGKTAENTED